MDKRYCKYCKREIEVKNAKVFANHVRWCNKNTTNGDKGLSKIKEFNSSRKKPRKYSNCLYCGKSLNIENQEVDRKFCNSSCACSYRNKNYKKTEKEINKIKNSVYNYIERTTGKKPKQEKHCPICGKTFYTKNKTCSVKCGVLLRDKNKNIDKDSLEYYRGLCKFDFQLSKYPEEFDFNLIEEYGFYKPKNRGNNLKGVSRDHIVSVKYGWINNIDPKIIKHPANCRLILQEENSSKGSQSSMTIEELVSKIEKWDKKYNGII